jgi:hypothetical protein
MENKLTITIIVMAIVVLAGIAAGFGIFSDFGKGPFIHESVRGLKVEIYGKGIYQHMSADVAIQGIAQDYVTLFIAIPLLLIALTGYRKKSLRFHFLLCGILGYFLVTYLFYTAMGMYNIMFLFYVALLALSFFGFFLTLRTLDNPDPEFNFSNKTPAKTIGCFMIFNAISVAFLWLSIIVPPLIDGTIYPVELKHYTTLIVQGFDLGLLLPISFIIGILLIHKKPAGFIYGTVYLVFLAILMTALSAKIIAMAMNDVNVIPVIFIIPTVNIIALLSAYFMVKNIPDKL